MADCAIGALVTFRVGARGATRNFRPHIVELAAGLHAQTGTSPLASSLATASNMLRMAVALACLSVRLSACLPVPLSDGRAFQFACQPVAADLSSCGAAREPRQAG